MSDHAEASPSPSSTETPAEGTAAEGAEKEERAGEQPPTGQLEEADDGEEGEEGEEGEDGEDADDQPSVDAPPGRRRAAPLLLVAGLVIAFVVGRAALPTSRSVAVRLEGERSDVRSIGLFVGPVADPEDDVSSIQWRYGAAAPPPPVVRTELRLPDGEHRFRVEVVRDSGEQTATTRIVKVDGPELTVRVPTHLRRDSEGLADDPSEGFEHSSSVQMFPHTGTIGTDPEPCDIMNDSPGSHVTHFSLVVVGPAGLSLGPVLFVVAAYLTCRTPSRYPICPGPVLLEPETS
jgi:hypothetical protein